MAEHIELTINGTTKNFAKSLTIASLLDELCLNPKQVAVEVNLELVPREFHGSHQLNAGDSVEVLTLVGGG